MPSYSELYKKEFGGGELFIYDEGHMMKHKLKVKLTKARPGIETVVCTRKEVDQLSMKHISKIECKASGEWPNNKPFHPDEFWIKLIPFLDLGVPLGILHSSYNSYSLHYHDINTRIL